MGSAGLVVVPDETVLPANTPEDIRKHYRFASEFYRLKNALLSEMAATGDDSLSSSNRNVIETVEQVLTLEMKTIDDVLKKMQVSTPMADAKRFRVTASDADQSDTVAPPNGSVCPITLQVMSDPVIAADGHSYERAAIEKWLLTSNISPATNLPLLHKNLVPNHSIKMVILQYREELGKAMATDGAANGAPQSVAALSVAAVGKKGGGSKGGGKKK